MDCFKHRPDIVAKTKEDFGFIRPALPMGVILIFDEIVRETKTEAGVILLAQNAKNFNFRFATVLAVGKKVTSVSFGDRVVISVYMGKELEYQYSHVCKMKLVSEDQIDAIIL
jgi:co-chaperonin GroES (HSP10)